MSKLRRLIQLHVQGKSKLFISRYLDLSRNTVDKYLAQHKLMGLSLADVEKLQILIWISCFLSGHRKSCRRA